MVNLLGKLKVALLLAAAVAGGLGVVAEKSLAADNLELTAQTVTRGEAVAKVVNFFDLEKQNAIFLSDCKANYGECYFSFLAKTNFDEVNVKPLILYPDVYPAHPFWREINVATALDLTQGYIQDAKSPFKPQAKIKRSEAWKIALGGAGLLDWKEQFELSAGELSAQGLGDLLRPAVLVQYAKLAWWQIRYANFALKNQLITAEQAISADEPITAAEFDKLLENAKSLASK